MNLNSSFTKSVKASILVLLLACSCSTTHYVGESKPVVEDLTFVIPYCRIDCLTEDGRFAYSDSLSAVAEMLIGVTVETLGLPIKTELTVVGRSNQEDLDRAYEGLAAISPSKLESWRMPAAMQALLSTFPSRHALLIYSEGFVRVPKPIFLNEDEIRYESHIYLLVADVRTGKAVYFNRSVPECADPLSARLIHKRVESLLSEFKDGK